MALIRALMHLLGRHTRACRGDQRCYDAVNRSGTRGRRRR